MKKGHGIVFSKIGKPFTNSGWYNEIKQISIVNEGHQSKQKSVQ